MGDYIIDVMPCISPELWLRERERETEAGKSRNEERWKIKRGPHEGKALACGTVSVCALA